QYVELIKIKRLVCADQPRQEVREPGWPENERLVEQRISPSGCKVSRRQQVCRTVPVLMPDRIDDEEQVEGCQSGKQDARRPPKEARRAKLRCCLQHALFHVVPRGCDGPGGRRPP